jgi:hypothetical protein
MPEYRAYRIKNDQIAGVPEIVVADDDRAAIEQARQLTNGHDVELWEGGRFVIGVKSTEAR